VIRKTLSISTLGIVDFRSKKELLRRAEKARRSAQAQLAGVEAARVVTDQRLAAAEKRARQAELLALQQAKKAQAAKGKRRQRRKAAASHARGTIEGLVSAATPAVEERAKDLSRRGRKTAAKARKQVEAAAEEAHKRASKQGRRARKRLERAAAAAGPRLEQAGDRLITLKDDAVKKATDLADR